MKALVLLFSVVIAGVVAHADEVRVNCMRQRYMCTKTGECYYSSVDPDAGDRNSVAIQQKYADGYGFEFWVGQLAYEIPAVGSFPAIPFSLNIKQDRYTNSPSKTYVAAVFKIDGTELQSGSAAEIHMQYLNPVSQVGFILDCYAR